MTVAVYLRVSTVDQNEAGQRAEIIKWLAGNGINQASVCWYVDKESGSTLDRPEFKQLQRDVFNGVVKTIVTYRLDRISRDMVDGVSVLSDWLKRGIRFVSITQQLDFTGATGQFILNVLLAVSQFEKQSILERQAAGIAAARERGVYTGRKPGSVKSGVNPAEAIRLKELGLKQEQIARSMGVSVRTVARYLKAG